MPGREQHAIAQRRDLPPRTAQYLDITGTPPSLVAVQRCSAVLPHYSMGKLASPPHRGATHTLLTTRVGRRMTPHYSRASDTYQQVSGSEKATGRSYVPSGNGGMADGDMALFE